MRVSPAFVHRMTGTTGTTPTLPGHTRSSEQYVRDGEILYRAGRARGAGHTDLRCHSPEQARTSHQFICYSGLAILPSRLKVNLPDITGTLSVNFLFFLTEYRQ